MQERKEMNLLRNRARQAGQGMTEYIIIVALVAVAAISVYNLFGDTVRGQVGDLAAELGGGTSKDLGKTAGKDSQTEGAAEYNLGAFQQAEK
jgi:Flp pilus assembly pilin Flp